MTITPPVKSRRHARPTLYFGASGEPMSFVQTGLYGSCASGVVGSKASALGPPFQSARKLARAYRIERRSVDGAYVRPTKILPAACVRLRNSCLYVQSLWAPPSSVNHCPESMLHFVKYSCTAPELEREEAVPGGDALRLPPVGDEDVRHHEQPLALETRPDLRHEARHRGGEVWRTAGTSRSSCRRDGRSGSG